MPSRRHEIRMSEDEALDLVRTEPYAVLATNGPDEFPHLVTVSVCVRDDGVLSIGSFAKSQKVANLRRSPHAALLVEVTERYSEIRGVLIRATVAISNDPDEVRHVHARIEQDARSRLRDDNDFPPIDSEHILPKRVVLNLTPTRITSWDHRRLGGAY